MIIHVIVALVSGTRTASRAAGAVADDHPLVDKSEVVWEDLADYPVSRAVGLPEAMQRALVPSTTPSGRPISVGLEVHSIAEVLAAVARGRIVHPTVATLADYTNQPGVRFLPIVDAQPSRSALFHRPGPLEPRVGAFVEHVRDGGECPARGVSGDVD